VTSRLVAECLDAVSVLANQNEVTLIWVPGHCGVPGSDKADRFARQGAVITLLGPQPPLGIPRYSVRVTVNNWTEIQHYTTWKNLPAYRHGKFFTSRPFKERAGDLLQQSKHELRMVIAFFTGHAPVKKHLNIMGLFDGDPKLQVLQVGG
jgi:hypothetical protein